MTSHIPITALRLTGVLLLCLSMSGCIATGIRVGPVFIPVDTGIGKEEPTKPPLEEKTEQETQQQEEQSEKSDEEKPI